MSLLKAMIDREIAGTGAHLSVWLWHVANKLFRERSSSLPKQFALYEVLVDVCPYLRLQLSAEPHPTSHQVYDSAPAWP